MIPKSEIKTIDYYFFKESNDETHTHLLLRSGELGVLTCALAYRMSCNLTYINNNLCGHM